MFSGSVFWAYSGSTPSVDVHPQAHLLIFIPLIQKDILPVLTTVWVVQDGTFRTIGPWEWYAYFRFGFAGTIIGAEQPQWLTLIHGSVPVNVNYLFTEGISVHVVWPVPLQDVLYQLASYEDLAGQFVIDTCSFPEGHLTHQHYFGWFFLIQRLFLLSMSEGTPFS